MDVDGLRAVIEGVWVVLASGRVGHVQMTTGAGSVLGCALVLTRL
jgi:hypothetical protein